MDFSIRVEIPSGPLALAVLSLSIMSTTSSSVHIGGLPIYQNEAELRQGYYHPKKEELC